MQRRSWILFVCAALCTQIALAADNSQPKPLPAVPPRDGGAPTASEPAVVPKAKPVQAPKPASTPAPKQTAQKKPAAKAQPAPDNPTPTATASAATSGSQCQMVTKSALEKMRESSSTLAGAKITNFKIVTRITHDPESTVDFFTRSTHKAHPAFVRRSVVPEGSGFTIKTEGFTAGDGAICNRWMSAFIKQDPRITGAR